MIEEDAKKAILKLFQCFNVSGSDAERKIKFAAYWDVLSTLPRDAIIAACRKASHGGIGDRGFLPSSAELYHAAVNELPVRKVAMITAKERDIPRDERERVSTLMRELAAGMEAALPRYKREYEPTAMTVDEFLKIKYRDRPLPKLSAELRKKLGAGIPEIRE